MTRLAGSNPADAQEVADAIYAAVYTDARKFRHVVGRSAEQIVALRTHADFEDFELSLRDLLDWHVGAPAAAATPGVM